MSKRFILASQSPRRQALLKLLQIPFDIIVADADEASITNPNPAANVVETAVLKANTIATRLSPHETAIIIAADTTVACENKMLGKPKSTEEAWQMLTWLRQTTHHVYTGLVLLESRSGKMLQRTSQSVVKMRNYTDPEIEAYIASGDPMDKAGAYAIQHEIFRPVAELDGCFTGVMGLSVCQLIEAFDTWTLPRPADLTAVSKAHINNGIAYPCSILANLHIN